MFLCRYLVSRIVDDCKNAFNFGHHEPEFLKCGYKIMRAKEDGNHTHITTLRVVFTPYTIRKECSIVVKERGGDGFVPRGTPVTIPIPVNPCDSRIKTLVGLVVPREGRADLFVIEDY